MLLYPTVPELLKNVNSRYLLVNVIAKRAREISSEAEENSVKLEEKAVTLAVRDIAAGKITASVLPAPVGASKNSLLSLSMVLYT